MNQFLNWDTKSYLCFQKELQKQADPKFQKFQQNLIKTSIPILGVRTPILKKMAIQIAKGDYENFLIYNTHQTYEEILLHGLVLGNLSVSFEKLIFLLEKWLPYNQTWATNDLTCSNLKQWKNHKKEGYLVIQNYLKNENPWIVRFGLVLLLTYYMEEDIHDILKLSNHITNTNYYVQMANAWLISYCYIHNPNSTYQFLLQNDLDTFTHNKAIQKIIESKQISKLEKEKLKILKR